MTYISSFDITLIRYYTTTNNKKEKLSNQSHSYIINESRSFLDSVNFQDFSKISSYNKSPNVDEFHGNADDLQRYRLDQDHQFSKHEDGQDDLFDDDSVHSKKEDDIFADSTEKDKRKPHEDEDEEDIFGGKSESKGDSEYDFGNHDNEDSDKDNAKMQKQATNEEVGDFFMKAIKRDTSNNETTRDGSEKFRHFGDLKDTKSTSLISKKQSQDINNVIRNYNNEPFKIEPSAQDCIELVEKYRQPVRNRNLVETRLYDTLTLQRYENKALNDKFFLHKLSKDDKLTTKHLILETQKKCRDIKFEYQENMNKVYDKELYNIKNDLLAKMRKENLENGHDIPDQIMMPENANQQINEEQDRANKNLTNLDELEEVSSIDSDIIQEERKYSSLGGILGKLDYFLNLIFIDSQNTIDPSRPHEHAK